MKIISINVSYGTGSTGKIVEALHKRFLKTGHNSYVIVGRKTTVLNEKIIKLTNELESKIWHLLSKFTGNLYNVCPISTWRIIRFIKKSKPDVVHLHCLNGFFLDIPRLINFLKKEKINTVLTNHAEFMFTANCGYTLGCNNWKNIECKECRRYKEINGIFSLNLTHYYYKKMFKAISNFSKLKVTSVSSWLNERLKQSKMFRALKENCFVVLNPVDTHEGQVNNYFSKEKKNILYVTADFNNPEKGGFNIFKLAEKCNNLNMKFFIKSGKKITQKLSFNNIEVIDDKNIDMFSLYESADCSLLLSQRETFSMVVAESLSCGTPIVGFRAGGPETIGIDKYSFFVNYGDINNLKEALLKMLNENVDREIIKKIASTKYSVNTIANEYLRIYEK